MILVQGNVREFGMNNASTNSCKVNSSSSITCDAISGYITGLDLSRSWLRAIAPAYCTAAGVKDSLRLSPTNNRLKVEGMNAFKAYKACVPIAWSPNLYITLVKRLVVIETEEMYNARKQKEENHRALRPPLVISHFPPAATGSL
ncbi:hypothetical protein L6164_029113 [Bauhinia variegata]|uniref:Uncharacterized protein n=1 Tax=Bauhinia variegata TaxID=167791 RepID=A0ACB9L8Z3_BAUVA|nr:hypothetical protein L6164_029113 [Bauhinia variegata]